MNNKVLLSVLGLLVLIFVSTNFFKKNNSKVILQTDLISIDSLKVNQIDIFNQNSDTITIIKDTDTWFVKNNIIETNAKLSEISRILDELSKIKIERLISKSKESWEKYQLSDSLVTKLVIFQGSKKLDLYLGKINYNAPEGNNQFNQQQNFIVKTNVRVNDDPRVYLIDGFLGMTFNRDINAFRSNEFISFDKSMIRELKFNTSNDSSFVLSKSDTIWKFGEIIVDQSKIDNYLNELSNTIITNYDDEFEVTNEVPSSLRIIGDNMIDLQVLAYKKDEKYILESSLNKNSFNSLTVDEYEKVFINLEDLF
tara:strand:+ start:5118 stop:6050 length:933 start_codon:yes stop_codon:yes gene_type:complete